MAFHDMWGKCIIERILFYAFVGVYSSFPILSYRSDIFLFQRCVCFFFLFSIDTFLFVII